MNLDSVVDTAIASDSRLRKVHEWIAQGIADTFINGDPDSPEHLMPHTLEFAQIRLAQYPNPRDAYNAYINTDIYGWESDGNIPLGWQGTAWYQLEALDFDDVLSEEEIAENREEREMWRF